MAEQSMRERAARAAAEAVLRDERAGLVQIPYWVHEICADAVLAEIETPTEGMVREGAKVHPAALCREVFTVMARAAREGR